MYQTNSQDGGATARLPHGRSEDSLKAVYRRLKECGQFACHLDSIHAQFEGNDLVLTGKVPSFYLKSLLQETLGGLPGDRKIINRVDVVNCEGLSSTRWAATTAKRNA